jgi:hypothetical protein
LLQRVENSTDGRGRFGLMPRAFEQDAQCPAHALIIRNQNWLTR